MSEYWKSVPKYWCKYCKTHVRDTALEKRNHEATPRHAGNLSRSLRDLHRDNEREARDNQRAKNEAARLNGMGASGGSERPPGGIAGGASGVGGAVVTPEDRKRQLAQLAALGVAVPDAFRQENAMAGEWEAPVTARATMPLPPKRQLGKGVKRDGDGVKGEGDELKKDGEDGTVHEEDAATLESRKRGADGEEWRERGPPKKRPVWGRDVKAYKFDVDDDLEALLGSSSTGIQIKRQESAGEEQTKTEPVIKAENPAVKAEAEDIAVASIPATLTEEKPTEPEDDKGQGSDIGSMFKKRTPRAIRRR